MNPIVMRRMIASSVMSAGVMLLTATGAGAEPDVAPAPAPPGSSADTTIVAADPAAPVDTDSPSSVACKQFSAALSYAATNYEDFAYATAGGGNYVDYGNHEVQNSNVVGRTALRDTGPAGAGAS